MPTQAEPDLSEFVALTGPRNKKKPCRVGAILEQLDATEAQQLRAAIAATADGTITVGAVVKWLEARGHDMDQNGVVHHRGRRCSCV